MKKWVVLIIAFLFTNILSQTNVSPQFSELKGMEDQQGKCSLLPIEISNLYPLSIGNKWVYRTITAVNPTITYGVALNEVIGDSIAANGKLYYHLRENDYHSLERVDTLEGKVYRYYEHPNLPGSEYVIVDLLGEPGDTLITFDPGSGGSTSYLIVASIDTFNNWGLSKLRKNYLRQAYPVSGHFSYTEDIGMDFWNSTILGYSAYFERKLKGCIINGIVYGDTTTVGVEDEEPPIASEFKLEQNYPNPFNPSTVISYQLPVSGNVSLKVYDVLGNEVATLADEYKPAETYEVEFNATGLTSGIYFYQLNAGSFIQVKKMVLVK